MDAVRRDSAIVMRMSTLPDKALFGMKIPRIIFFPFFGVENPTKPPTKLALALFFYLGW